MSRPIVFSIVEGGVVQGIYNRKAEEYEDGFVIDLDNWCSDLCPVCLDRGMDIGPDDDIRCGNCGANENMSYEQLIQCFLEMEK